MLKVIVQLHSAVTGDVEVLGEGTICNVGGTRSVGRYRVELFKWARAKSAGVWKKAWVDGFPRQRLGHWDLLLRCLHSAIGYRNDEALKEADLPEQGAAYWKQRAFDAEDRLEAFKRAMGTLRLSELAKIAKERADTEPRTRAFMAQVAAGEADLGTAAAAALRPTRTKIRRGSMPKPET